jgi:hypothetical protein
MNAKKPYSAPQLFQVDLNHEQAILSACSIAASNSMVGGGNQACKPAGCKQASSGIGTDSGSRPS